MVTLSIFCASHISTDDNFRHVQAMIASVQAQAVRTKLWISVSHSDDLNHNETQQWLIKQLPGGSHCVVANSRKSQFEHFQLLVNAYIKHHPSATTTTSAFDHWISFIDDDDTIGPQRIAAFLQLIPRSIRRRLKLPPFNDVPGTVPAHEQVIIVDSREPDQTEYWQFAVTARLLSWWFDHTGPLLWRNMHADIFLSNFLRSFSPTVDSTQLHDDAARNSGIGYNHTERQNRAGKRSRHRCLAQPLARYGHRPSTTGAW